MSGDFEGKSLDALHAMVASARPGDLTKAGGLLEAAAPQIIQIASDLRLYLDKVQWKGEGGDAFRLWGADMVSETLKLSDFASTVGAEMQRAGQALGETQKSMPKPAGMCFADPEKEEARIKDETGPKLQEAIRLMERLSSYYKTAKGRMESEPEPKFPLPPTRFVKNGEYSDARGGFGSGAGSSYSAAGAGGYAGGSSYSTSAPSSYGSTESMSTRQAQEHTARPSGPVGPGVVPEVPVGMNLDSVAPPAPQETGSRPPAQTVTSPPVTTGPSGPGPLPPVSTGLSPKQGGPGMPRVPVGPGGPGMPVGPVGPGMARGAGPVGPGPMGGMPRVGGADGIMGGKPTHGWTNGSPSGSRPPLGTVIGEERHPMGRGPMGMPGQGVGPYGGTGPGAGSGSGRRLAVQPGGTVGGSGASGPVGRGTFTPGGTGLVRPPGSAEPGREERRQAAGRPDYLAEDEETWTMGQRKIVPPVID
ncbi:WXG100 family type VII secretion target [Streptomyces fradiae]|uniref:WXG100 family type VII secretion target n=1 Tax=Streptomyces fradiae TaxID=1906 RepID=UPI003985B6D7